MLPGKSFSFLKFNSVDEANVILQSMNGESKFGQNGSVLYMAFCKEPPRLTDDPWKNPGPPGLIILEEIISEEEETRLMKLIDWNSETVTQDSNSTDCRKDLKHRKVRHYGYKFIYTNGTNNVDTSNPLELKIPTEFEDYLFTRLEKELPSVKFTRPDQMTVNKYEPGQGIPPHVDTHSAFEDPIMSLSIGSDVVMEFRKKDATVAVQLPRRSVLIMSEESRYGWTHGITPRMTDIVPTTQGLTVKRRGTRISCTFRKIQPVPRCNCNFPELCDLQKAPILNECDSKVAAKLEEENVHKVYDEIANHFSETRHSPWPQVQDFLNSFNTGSVLLDIGCGNGKYLGLNPNITVIGCDRSEGLLKVCINRNLNAFQCNCLSVPVRDTSVDGCISIAVIHHLATENRRLQAIQEMSRVLVKGGQGLLYVWAKDQKADSKKSSYLRQNKQENKRDKRREVVPDTVDAIEEVKQMNGDITLPVHRNRTQFKHQDVLVPWKLKGQEQIKQNGDGTFLRYYHVFEQGELETLCKKINEIQVLRSYYDQGNWCVIFEKIKS